MIATTTRWTRSSGTVASRASSNVGIGVSDQSGAASGQLTVGVSGARRNAAAAACEDGVLTAFCEQERLSRVRGVRLERGTLPVDAVSAVLKLAGDRRAADVWKYVVAEDEAALPTDLPCARIEHHLAHAASAFYNSSFQQAAVLVCDHHSTPQLSVWVGDGSALRRHPWRGELGFASLYSACSEVFGLPPGQEHQLEALARLDPCVETGGLDENIGYEDRAVWASAGWKGVIADRLADDAGDPVHRRARIASDFQRHLGRLLLQLVSDVRADTGMRHLCLAGGLFYNTYFNTVVHRAGIFDDVFVAPSPGNAGVAAGAALAEGARDFVRRPDRVSPFLGPEYNWKRSSGRWTIANCRTTA